MSKILVIETALGGTLVGLVEVLESGSISWPTMALNRDPYSAAKELPGLTQQVLRNANIEIAEIDGFAIGNGPGSFTGIKIGLSFAAGLKAGSEKSLSCFGFSSLDAVLKGSNLLGGCANYAVIPSTSTKGFLATLPYGCSHNSNENLWSLDINGKMDAISHEGRTQNGYWQIQQSDRVILLGAWQELEKRLVESSVDWQIADFDDRVPWLVQGIGQKILEAWPEKFDLQVPNPNYLRLSTAEESNLKSMIRK